jgi:formylglycine-generating enzyme required for sulfatase activity
MGGGYEPGWVLNDNISIAPSNANLGLNVNLGDFYATWTASPGSQENLPINHANWWEAYAFCIWDGGFLPSEAEWEYAAAGGSQQREYPWGSADPGTANQYAICAFSTPQDLSCFYPREDACRGVANIAPVGTAMLGAGLWGQLDLVGDEDEWTLDWFANYAACTDCADLTAAYSRVTRGGAFATPAPLMLVSIRNGDAPDFRSGGNGFRCARSP